MAKCILLDDGRVIRVSDDDAYLMVVYDQDGQYCPKSMWKDDRKKLGETKPIKSKRKRKNSS